MKKCIIKIEMNDGYTYNIDFTYKYLCQVFSEIDSILILKNKTENDILNIKIDFKEEHLYEQR